MKKTSNLLAILVCTFIFSASHAQSLSDTLKANGYLYEHFEPGFVVLHGGTTQQAPVNYNTNTQEIAFIQDGHLLILSNLDAIDTVFMGERKFIAHEGKFYEVGAAGNMPLLISYDNRKVPVSATVDHNGTSKQYDREVSNTVSEVYMNRRYKGNFVLEFVPQFWIRRGHTLYKANSEKQLEKIFPQKTNTIKDYVAAHHTVFSNTSELAQLVTTLQ
ncbi:hypothetical protein [Deminuibacter soli]|uniref:DUF4369 domain-containing protein n=1 Tax=Deminuibacter soli TaxID=2291815 RepID=A0A3E1NGK5_9BACT|nr:hypothetical protein [Deminuibacter soli]RFM27096.1 hypothetical protein DXN05_16655 [Deminuibacter soli]